MDKAQDFVVLFLLANVGVGVAENALIGVLHEECQHSLPPAAAFGDLMLSHQGVFAMKGDGVKIHMKADTPLESQAAHGIEPPMHELGEAGLVEDAPDGRRADNLLFLPQGADNIVDG